MPLLATQQPILQAAGAHFIHSECEAKQSQSMLPRKKLSDHLAYTYTIRNPFRASTPLSPGFCLLIQLLFHYCLESRCVVEKSFHRITCHRGQVARNPVCMLVATCHFKHSLDKSGNFVRWMDATISWEPDLKCDRIKIQLAGQNRRHARSECL